MDAGALLTQARDLAGVSQRVLARRTGTGQSAISAYESGTTSPTVRMLDRLLAACDLEARVALHPLGADIDAHVASLLSGAPDLDVESLLSLQKSLDDDPTAVRMSFAPWQPAGVATWAFDAATALRVQGLAVPEREVAIALVLDEAGRQWLWRLGVKGTGRFVAPHWLDDEPEHLAEVLRWPAACMFGLLQIRLCEALPSVIKVAIGASGQTVPVVTVDAVEQSHPEHAQVLAAWRERRTVGT